MKHSGSSKVACVVSVFLTQSKKQCFVIVTSLALCLEQYSKRENGLLKTIDKKKKQFQPVLFALGVWD